MNNAVRPRPKAWQTRREFDRHDVTAEKRGWCAMEQKNATTPFTRQQAANGCSVHTQRGYARDLHAFAHGLGALEGPVAAGHPPYLGDASS